MTVSELIEALEKYDKQTEVEILLQVNIKLQIGTSVKDISTEYYPSGKVYGVSIEHGIIKITGS